MTPWETREVTAAGRLVKPDDIKQQPGPGPRPLKCFMCGDKFNPNDSKINGVRVAPSAHCNPCQQANFKAGRWQEVFRLEAATAKENA